MIGTKHFKQVINGKKVLILGGTGLFSRHLIERWNTLIKEENIDVKLTICTRDRKNALKTNRQLNHEYIEIKEIDFEKEDEIKGEYDYIFHMANASAKDTYKGISQIRKYNILINATRAVQNIVEKGGVKRVIFTSSGVAYGNMKYDYKEEYGSNINHLCKQSTLGFAKLVCEHQLNSVCTEKNCSLVIARCFSFISEYMPMDIHYAVGNFIENAIKNEDIVIKSDGNDVRSYQYLEDTCIWLEKLMIMEKPPQVINIGSDEKIKIRDLALLVKEIVNNDCQIKILNQSPPNDNQRRAFYVPNLELAREYGLVNTHGLRDAIGKVANRRKLLLDLNENQ